MPTFRDRNLRVGSLPEKAIAEMQPVWRRKAEFYKYDRAYMWPQYRMGMQRRADAVRPVVANETVASTCW
jgi:hypothetical protein